MPVMVSPSIESASLQNAACQLEKF